MNNLLKLEEAAQFFGAFYLLYLLPIELAWWLWIILFLAPDLGMLGYVVNTKVGAITYNLFHHKMIAVAIGIYGLVIQNVPLQAAGLLLFGHASFDRMMGYGLKYSYSFKNTHLGQL